MLLSAIDNHDIEEIKNLLESQQCAINGDGTERNPPIFQCVDTTCRRAAEADCRGCDMLKMLLQYGADVNVQVEGNTAALAAAQRGYARCVQVLVESGADLTVTTHQGDTPLIQAVKHGAATTVRCLTGYSSVSMLNHRNNDGQTALMLATSNECFLCLRPLLDAGADVNVKDDDGNTALMCALRKDSPEAVTLLLEKGACVNTVTQSGDTPLSVAIGYKQLVELGYLSRLRNYRSRRVQVGYNMIVLKLLRLGLDPTLSYKDRHSLHTVVAGGQETVVRGLVRNGFPPLDLDCKTIRSDSPGHPLSLFLSWAPSTRLSPLALALLCGRLRIARYLIVNSFFTHYDIVRLCWDPNIRRALGEACSTGNSHKYNYHWASSFEVEESTTQARQCLQLLDSLASTPHSLLTLSLITISSALSQHLTKHPLTLTETNKWICKQTFREKVQVLEIPPSLKRALLHQTPFSKICCRSWDDILIGEEVCLPPCGCRHCEE